MSLLLTTIGAFSHEVLHRRLSLASLSGNMICLLTDAIPEEYVHSASLLLPGLLSLESCLAT